MITRAYTLIAHPSAPTQSITAIAVKLERIASRRIALSYHLSGDISALDIPAEIRVERTDYLWKTTCCELFLQDVSGSGYCEFNLSPSSCWAAYRFNGFRAAMRDLPMASPPIIRVEQDSAQLQLLAELDFAEDALPAALDGAAVGLTMVVAERGGMTSYWALSHPFPKPDFHHADGFIAAIPED